MTRVLVVHHDQDMADEQADGLRRRGYTAVQCSGPNYHSCPILRGEPCAVVAEADVLVYDVWSAGSSGSGQQLIEQLRDFHPEIPLVVVDQGLSPDWIEISGVHRVTPVIGVPTGDRLAAAVEQALGDASRVVVTPT